MNALLPSIHLECCYMLSSWWSKLGQWFSEALNWMWKARFAMNYL
jgi:hypothetical protein